MKKFIYTSITLTYFLFAVITASSQPYKRVAVIGSSTAFGFFPAPSPAYPQDSGWVGKLEQYYKNLNIIDTIYNLGCIGRDCYAGMPTGYTPPAGESYPDINSNITKAISMLPKPDVIIVNYPSNNYERLDNDSIIQCLRAIKNEANANGIRCYIATTQPRNSFDAAGRQKLKDLRDIMLSTFGVWAIDFFTPLVEEPSLNTLPAYDLGDNIHINPDGHTVLMNKVIAKNIFFVVLPVRMDYFNASTVSNKTLLNWATSFEDNNSRFEVQRSSNGRSFEPLAVVNSGGNSSVTQQYQYIDPTKNLQGFFYRIAAVSNSGGRQLSPVVFVAPASKIFTVGNIYPSPSSNSIHTEVALSGKQNIDITVTDAAGKKMVHQHISANTLLQYQLDISKFSTGNYFIRFSCNGQEEVLSFTRQ